MNKVAIVLSGCGYLDGTEINEAVFTMLALSKTGVDYQCLAPNIEQDHVSNYITNETEDVNHNVLKEAARVARGNIVDLSEAVADDYSAVIFPGGYGVATTLCDFATTGENMQVNEQIVSFAQAFHDTDKPIGLMCIAPVLAPKIIPGTKVTIGNDKDIADSIVKMGGEHIDCVVTDIIIDEKNKIVSTPAFMISENLYDVFIGVEKLIKKVVELS